MRGSILTIIVFSVILFTSGIVGMMPSVFAQPAAGDIIVSDDLIGIIQVDPTTGAQTIISSSTIPGIPGVLISFTAVVIDANGDIIGSELNTGAITKVDPTTGAQTTISSGGSLTDPAGIAIDANGDIIVANVGFPAAIIKIDPTTGAQIIISSGGLFDGPNGIAIDANGDIIVSDFNIGDITKVDPTTGVQTTISSGGSLTETAGVSIAANGDIIVAVIFPPAIIKVDPTTGAQTTISSGGLLLEPNGIAIDANGDIIVADPTALAIIKVDPTTGVQTTISSGGLFEANFWLTIYPTLADSDNDGISDEVDTQPSTFSDDFSDVTLGGITTGTITTRGGQTLMITEEPNPAGVKIAADISGGPPKARVDACGGATTINFDAGDEVVVTCTSVTIQVISGIVEVTFTDVNNDTAAATLDADDELTFDPETFTLESTGGTATEIVLVADDGTTADVTLPPNTSITYNPETSIITNTSSEDVTIIIDGEQTTILPGDTDVVNIPPTVGPITAPIDPVQINTSITATADFTDPGTIDTHTAQWDWGDGTVEAGTVSQGAGTGSVTNLHTYNVPGIYTVTLTVTDDGGSDSETFEFIVVYDPSGGFVTGGGWIDSPVGAFPADSDLTGKANFGFVSKFKKGDTIPIGVTEFQFKVADLNFRSNSYEWLVIAGAKAMYKGVGTMNGEGNFEFKLSAIDEKQTSSTDTDLFRIKIVDKDTGTLIYDNKVSETDDNADPTTEISGGSIVVHKAN